MLWETRHFARNQQISAKVANQVQGDDCVLTASHYLQNDKVIHSCHRALVARSIRKTEIIVTNEPCYEKTVKI